MKKKKDILCRRCGACCRTDFIAYVCTEDIERWEREGREDILERIRNNEEIWIGDRIINKYGEKVKNCVYLNVEGDLYFCEIYDTRPLVCHNYVPGSSEICSVFYEK